MSGAQFDSADLRSHAGSVRALADRVDVARDAAGQALPSALSFGLLCSPVLAPVYEVLSGAAQNSIGAAAGRLEHAAGGLDATALAYDSAEIANCAEISQAEIARAEQPR